jgi:putative sugar O-methyltransferase
MQSDIATEIAPMLEELRKHPEFMPSEFWSDLGIKNLRMLEQEGVENLKRTVSNNYFNWLIFTRKDPQYDNVFRQWKQRPSLRTLLFWVAGDRTVQTMLQTAATPLKRVQAWRYGFFVSMLWDLGLRLDKHGILARLEEPKLGNPIRVMRGGRIIAQDLVNSSLELGVILDLPRVRPGPLKVAELGAGYGRLGHAFLATQPGQYCIFDIPPALYVAQWYLTKLLPNKRVFRFRPFSHWSEVAEEVAQADVAFFTSNQLALVPDRYFDVVTSISTLPEMSMVQVRLFLKQFARTSAGHVFLKQWTSWKNPLDGTNLTMDDYVLGGDWKVTLDQVDPFNPLFFNRVWTLAQ